MAVLSNRGVRPWTIKISFSRHQQNASPGTKGSLQAPSRPFGQSRQKAKRSDHRNITPAHEPVKRLSQAKDSKKHFEFKQSPCRLNYLRMASEQRVSARYMRRQPQMRSARAQKHLPIILLEARGRIGLWLFAMQTPCKLFYSAWQISWLATCGSVYWTFGAPGEISNSRPPDS